MLMIWFNDDLLHLRKLSFEEISINMFGTTPRHRLVKKFPVVYLISKFLCLFVDNFITLFVNRSV